MSKKAGESKALALAQEKLQELDLRQRAAILGLPSPQNNVILLRCFGKDMLLKQEGWELLTLKDHQPAKTADRIILLHYLQCELPIKATGEMISFRHLPGGQFYWEPFCSRSVKPLLQSFKNNLAGLKKNLDERFDWQSLALGDFAARIHLLGPLYLTLVWHEADEDFPAAIDLVFDSCIKKAFCTEDCAVVASRICLGLL